MGEQKKEWKAPAPRWKHLSCLAQIQRVCFVWPLPFLLHFNYLGLNSRWIWEVSIPAFGNHKCNTQGCSPFFFSSLSRVCHLPAQVGSNSSQPEVGMSIHRLQDAAHPTWGILKGVFPHQRKELPLLIFGFLPFSSKLR